MLVKPECHFNLFVYRALDKCDPGLFNKLVGIYPELAAHERAVDVLIDLFKKDQVNDKPEINYCIPLFSFWQEKFVTRQISVSTDFVCVCIF